MYPSLPAAHGQHAACPPRMVWNRILLSIFSICCCCLVSAQQLSAQTSQVKGALIDHDEFTPLSKGVVMVLQSQDSILVKYTRSDEKGHFQVADLPQGQYLLYVSYPQYADYTMPFEVSGQGLDLGKISMKLRAKLLEEVLITGIEAVRIKGDTTEFDPRAFVIEPNSKVEDLLKQFPGIQINAQGQITAQGKRVSKVLLDGEEFFGDDPTLLTRNIRGDMVKKVQLYDKKSDQTEFTGVDDGQRETTINVVTHEHMRKGSFGKAEAGAGTNDMYLGQAMYNIFNNKLRASVYGTLSNTGRTGLSWSDNQRYGSSSSSVEFMNGGMMMAIGGDDMETFDGYYAGSGIPKATTGGAHFNNKWKENTRGLNTSYKFNQLDVEGRTQSLNQNILPTGTLFNESDQNFDQNAIKHKLDAIYEHQIDSNASFQLKVGVSRNHSENNNRQINKSLNEQGQLINEGSRSSTTEGEQSTMYTDFLWRKKFAKPGRTFSWNLNFDYNEAGSVGNLLSNNQFYQSNGQLDSTDVIDQHKRNESVQTKWLSKLSLTESINRQLSMSLSYLFQYNNGLNHLQSFNKGTQGQYDLLDSIFSNDFKLNQISNQATATLSYNKGAHQVQVGSDLTHIRFDQLDRFSSIGYKRNFINISPSVFYTLKLRNNSSVNLNYRGQNRQPSIDQLQPVRVNTDPLNIQLGNPDLKPSFSNHFTLSNSGYKLLSNRGYMLNLNFGQVLNPIVMDRVTDTAGRSTYRSVNLDAHENLNYGLYATYYFNAWGVNIFFNTQYNGSKNYSLINSTINQLTNNTYGVSSRLDYYSQGKFHVSLDFSPNYTQSVASLQKQQNNSGWNYSASLNTAVHLPFKTQLSLDANYNYNGPTDAFAEPFRQVLMNASASKKFFKNESLVLELSGRDLLNQNKGFSRYASSNYIYQTQQTTLKRYFMLSLKWDFSRMGGQSSPAGAVAGGNTDIVF
jgi:hypothetical protein